MTSTRWQERAALGQSLAADFEDPGVARRLIALLLDPDDTWVTRQTAAALWGMRRPEVVRLVLVASSRADDNHNDYLIGALADFPAQSPGDEDHFIREALIAVHDDPDPALAGIARV